MKIWSSTEIWDMVEKMPVFELRKEFILKSDYDELTRQNKILRTAIESALSELKAVYPRTAIEILNEALKSTLENV